MSRTFKRTLYVLAALLVVVYSIVLIRAWPTADERARQTPVAKTLAVNVAWNQTAVQITNSGAAAGSTFTVYLNDNPPFTYKADAIMPPVGESVRIPLNQFLKKDGERFNPLTHAVTEAWVGGGDYDYRKYSR